MKHNDNIERAIRENAEMIKIPNELEPQNIAVMLKEKRAEKSAKAIKRNRAMRFAAGATAFAVVATSGVFVAKDAGMFDSQILKDENISNSNTDDGENNSVSDGENIIDTPKASYEEIFDTLEDAKDARYESDDEVGFFDKLFGWNSTNNKNDVSADGSFSDSTDDMVFEENETMDEDDNMAPGGAMDSEGESTETPDKDFSETISQVEGIDEADIVKTNGEDIFYIIDNFVYGISVENGVFGESNILFGPSLKANETILDMYLYENALVLVCEEYSYDIDSTVYSDDIFVEDAIIDDGFVHPNGYGNTNVYIINLEDNSESSYTQSGMHISSRMIDDKLLLVTNDDSRELGNIDPEYKPSYIPSYYCNGEEEYIPAEDIVVSEDIASLSYCITALIDVNAPDSPLAIKAFAGSSGEIYCSAENLYVTGYTYDYDSYMSYTKITRLDLSNNLEIASQGQVAGTVLNQYSMDEYDGYFRIATNFYDNEEYIDKNNVYVLDMSLNTVGKSEDLGIGETIRSVRFEGNLGYVVTFMQTDPLYALDLSDPANPIMLDEFKVSGYSTYLHPYKDNLMFSFGVEANEATGWTTGIKIMMYDTTDPENLVLLDSYTWENIDYKYDDILNYTETYLNYDSNALYDEKALFIDAERNLIGLPIFKYSYNYSDYDIEEIFSAQYYIFTFENGKFNMVFDYENSLDFSDNENEYYYYYDIDMEFERAVRIDEYLYVLSPNLFFSVNFADMSVADTYSISIE